MHKIITLKNGIRLVHEHMPHVRSVAVGVWVGVGSRYERAGEGGYAHFIEHMLFKGTKNHTAAELADIMDGIGGQVNAYTTRESTCFYARVLDINLTRTIDLLGEMFFDSLFDEDDIVSERGVIFEEIDMYEDAGEDVCVERMMKSSFKGALGKPILGTKRSLNAATGASLRDFMQRYYVPNRITISLCGNFTESDLVHISELFSKLEAKRQPKFKACAYEPSFNVKRKTAEQNHISFGFPSLKESDERRFILHALSTTLGGGMSSRLFQSIRERHGLCYSVYSFSASHNDTGLFGIATALNSEQEQRAISLILDEVKKICDDGITADELNRATQQAKSSILLSLESTSSRMNRLGSAHTLLGSCLTVDEVIERCDAVTREAVLSLAREIFTTEQMSFSAVGKIADAEVYKNLL